MFSKTSIFVFVFTFLAAFAVVPALALEDSIIPDFPSCSSPNGTLKVSYTEGTHGIVGNGSFVGSDAVYIVGDSNLLQCFCAANGSGIQTNWWKVKSLSSDQIKTLQADGWIYVPTGLVWGLDDAAYFAKNISYSCGNVSTGGGDPGTSQAGAPVCDSAKPAAPVLTSVVRNGSSATLTWTKVDLADHYVLSYGVSPGKWIYGVPNTGNVSAFTINGLDPNTKYYFAVRAVNNCMPSDESVTPQVLGAYTGGQVLGLANTGNTAFISGLVIFGVLTLILAFVSRKNHREA
jgi:hypothetical protein